MNNWDKFKSKKVPEIKPEGREVSGMYQCQFCPNYVMTATYYPLDNVLKYRCSEGHLSFLEGFKIEF